MNYFLQVFLYFSEQCLDLIFLRNRGSDNKTILFSYEALL